jgi:hypothetical protein
MANHTTHIRRVYSRSWQRGPAANLGKVSTESACARRPRNATKRRFGVVVTGDLPELLDTFNGVGGRKQEPTETTAQGAIRA